MPKKQIQVHDSFFKNLFSKKEEVTEFVTKTFPPEIVKKLHLKTLELDHTEYVDDELKKYFADKVYDCDYNYTDSKTGKVKITLLFEHKSTMENFPHLQLLRYLLNVWETQIKQAKDRDSNIKMKDFRLKPVIPIIFYHGKNKWNTEPFEISFEGMDKLLIKFLPQFDYHLIDMSEYPDSKIKELFKRPELQISLLLMKNIFYEPKLLDLIKEIFVGVDNYDNRQERLFYESITNYIYHSANINFKKLIEIMETLSTQGSKIFISTAMQLEMKGKLKGRIEGIETGIKKVAFLMIQRGDTNKAIKEVTGLNTLQIKYLRTLDEYLIDEETS